MPRCLLLMLWTAPAPRDRSAVDWLSQPERFKKVRQATTVAFEVEGIGEDRRGNADKVDPGIGTTRMGQRIFEWVLSIGTRSAQSIMASGFTAAQTGRTHDRTRPMLQQLRKFLPRRRRPHMTQTGHRPDQNPAVQRCGVYRRISRISKTGQFGAFLPEHRATVFARSRSNFFKSDSLARMSSR